MGGHQKGLKEASLENSIDGLPIDEQMGSLSEIGLKICSKYVPQRQTKLRKSPFQKRRRILWKKMKRLKVKLSEFKEVDKTKRKIKDIEKSILSSFDDERASREKRAIGKIKSDPKYFYKFANETVKAKTTIGPLETGNKLIDDDQEMSNILRKQFAFSFSTPREKLDVNEFFDQDHPGLLTDIFITEEDIIEAAKELPNETSPGPDSWPAKFIKDCITELATPLKTIFNNSLKTGEIPKVFLQAHIIPTHKGGSKQLPENYRPISLTSLIAKIFERIIRKYILKFLDETNAIHQSQHGFRKQRSCLSQLLEHHDRIIDALESGGSYDVIYTDFAKAFDKCDFTILCRKLINLGISGNLGRWIYRFLSQRKFQVIVNDSLSDEEEVKSSVPQGTILAPLLFLIMINDIGKDIEECDIGTFADDTKLSKCIKTPEDSICLQKGLTTMFDWAEEGNMKFNGNKFLHIRHQVDCLNQCDAKYKTKDGLEIKKVPQTKDLGTIISSDLSFRPDRERAIQKARQKAGWALRTFKSRDQITIMTLYQSLVLPHIEYNSILTNPALKKEISQIERIQKSMTSRITSLKSKNYWERLKILDIYSLERRRERFIIIYTWRIIQNLAPNLPKNPISVYPDSRRGRLCRVPRPDHNASRKCQKLREESFAVKGPKLFNLLPASLRNLDSVKISTFKRCLDKYLKSIPDEPVIDDYAARNFENSNSLLHMIPSQTRNLG